MLLNPIQAWYKKTLNWQTPGTEPEPDWQLLFQYYGTTNPKENTTGSSGTGSSSGGTGTGGSSSSSGTGTGGSSSSSGTYYYCRVGAKVSLNDFFLGYDYSSSNSEELIRTNTQFSYFYTIRFNVAPGTKQLYFRVLDTNMQVVDRCILAIENSSYGTDNYVQAYVYDSTDWNQAFIYGDQWIIIASDTGRNLFNMFFRAGYRVEFCVT